LSSGPESRRAEPKRIVGLAMRTTNTAESDPSSAKIPKLWERFGKERWAERLDFAERLLSKAREERRIGS